MSDAIPAQNMRDYQREHLDRYLASDGADGHMYNANPPGYGPMVVPALLLTTTGRKSGQRYIFPLYYAEAGHSYVIVASKGGAPDHPNWFKNLMADPEVEVQVGAKKMKAVARVAEGIERAALWEKCVAVWPPYTDCAKKTDRTIPVVVLDPAP